MNHLQLFVYCLLLIVLLLLAAFFSLAETSIMAVSRYHLRHEERMNKGYAKRLLHLLKRPDKILSAVLIGNTVANMIASSLATLLAYHFLGEEGALMVAFLLTIIVLIFAEILPKMIAAMYARKIVRFIVYPAQFFLKILYPLVWFANLITNLFLSFTHLKIKNYAVEPVSREEFRSIIYDTSGKISSEYQHMLLSILDLNDLAVDDVMVPRHEIEGLDVTQPLEDMLKIIKNNKHAWLLLYDENINNIVGVLYAETLINFLLTGQILDKKYLAKLAATPYFVPEGTAIIAQLNYFRQNEFKMALVVDEYGEVQGLLTINDILEEIVGDFTHFAEPQRVTKEMDGSYLVEGTVVVREFNRSTDFELPVNGPRTMNGLIIEYLEALPKKGVSVLIADYPVEVMKVKDNRVTLARVSPKITMND